MRPRASCDIDYLHARFSSPVTGRFLSTDPVLNPKRALKKPRNWNRYGYGLGSPMKYVDPNGEDARTSYYALNSEEKIVLAVLFGAVGVDAAVAKATAGEVAATAACRHRSPWALESTRSPVRVEKLGLLQRAKCTRMVMVDE